MEELNVGVIGIGFWGQCHTRIFHEMKKAKLIAVCDINKKLSKSVGVQYNVDWYSDLDSFLKREDIEAVTICTPTTTHFEVSLNALEYGKHVLIEKPMTNTVKEAEKLIETAKSNNLILTVGFVERFNPGVKNVKKIINEGKIGNPVLIYSRRVGPFWPDRVGDVGVVKDVAIHDVDIFNYLFERKIIEVYAVGGALKHRFEDHVNVVLKMEDELFGFIESNWLTPHKIRKLNITGSNGILSLDYTSQEIIIEDNFKAIKLKNEWDEPLRIEIESFVNSILDDAPLEVTSENGKHALEVAEAILKSIRKRKPVAIKKRYLF